MSDESTAWDQTLDIFARLRGDKSQSDPYFEPLPVKGEEDFQRLKNTLVPLDAAIMAIHLAAARLSFRSLPSEVRRKLEDLKKMIEETLVLTKGNPNWFSWLAWFKAIWVSWREIERMRYVERQIRGQARSVMDDLLTNQGMKHHRKKVWEMVYSRHKPKKRGKRK